MNSQPPPVVVPPTPADLARMEQQARAGQATPASINATAMPRLWFRLRCTFGGGCLVGALYRRGGPAALERLLADLAADDERLGA